MSKIPQGEWSAIAARHAKGESLSAIARSYGCTPPAIHYVLKRNGKQAVEKVEPAAESPPPAPNEPRYEVRPQTLRLNGGFKHSTNLPTEPSAGSDRDPAPPASRPVHIEHRPAAALHPPSGSARSEQRPVGEPPAMAAPLAAHEPLAVSAPQRPLGFSATASRPLAVTDGLDCELHQRAEAAIETFRSCFEAALAEGSPQHRAHLRQAASDLMRVAARTTNVLDRLNAVGERAAARFEPRPNRSWPG